MHTNLLTQMHICAILSLLNMPTLPQADPRVQMRVDVRRSFRNRLKSEAALRGKTMGELIEQVVTAEIGKPAVQTEDPKKEAAA